ncbi:cytochrome P450 [Bacillus sp. DNRA2]|uniref:cytochrome P450 n=1 Tax=Bacillus sp. DNRA2 TaxID=2723053 RepID=UPI00145CE178|nr:cytochrome P450 [Bacillus sp. DNRA2]NMD71724.1 cytochrome P450 [Bacillus sp. DNRA2]
MKTKQISKKNQDLLLSAPEFLKNPYPFYEEMRSANPILKMSAYKYSGWYVTGYDEAVTILKNNKFQNRTPLPPTTRKYEELKTIQDNMLVFKNQQDHKRLRMLMSKGFTPNVIDGIRPYMEKIALELLTQAKVAKQMDVVSDFAFSLASHVIAKLLGVPKEDRNLFREWTIELIPTIDFTRSRMVLANGNDVIKDFMMYFKGLINNRRQQPQQDFISQLIKDEQEGDRLSEDELLAACILLVIAGHETTVNLISNTILTLKNNPEQLVLLRENPDLIEPAIDEVLRYESPTQLTARVAAERVEVAGVTIEQGEQVYIMLGAANRDPKQFKNPAQFDITRSPNPHLAFGSGSHFCLGASLARLEAQVALQTFLESVECFEVDSEGVQWRKLVGFRALETLPIILECEK